MLSNHNRLMMFGATPNHLQVNWFKYYKKSRWELFETLTGNSVLLEIVLNSEIITQ